MHVPSGIAYADLPKQARVALARVVAHARSHLGCLLSVTREDRTVTLRITEVEAYGAGYDPAAHSYRGESARNQSMFGPAGHAYVYRHMGLHHCFNIVVGQGCGVLIRAGQVVDGLETARARRRASGVTRTDTDLASGPARLTVALGITLADDGHPLDGTTGLRLIRREGDEPRIITGPRIGISRARDFPLRLWIDGDPTVSR